MIKMFSNDSLHHTYMDQPYTYFILLLLYNPWPLPYSTKFWRGEILVDSPVTVKILQSKCITLHYTASSVTVMFNRQNITIQMHHITLHSIQCYVQPPKYYYPKASLGFIHQRLIPPKFCDM